MKILVQKFGGTSVATPELREQVINKIRKATDAGYGIVTVVSAMGRKGEPYATDTLLSLVRGCRIAERELDLLMACGEIISANVMTAALQDAGLEAVMLTGQQAGIVTDSHFTNARILKVDTNNILRHLDAGKVVVVAGFQGATAEGEITTLGRGGSDTTASALGAALNAETIEIYTDVEGVMTADPRIVNCARKLDVVSYSEVCQLAHEGAKVIHPRAVEIAMQKNIPLVVKCTFSDAAGTLITNPATDRFESNKIEDRIVIGITNVKNISQIKVDLNGKENRTHCSYTIFKIMADSGISVDLINVGPDVVLFTVNEDVVQKAIMLLTESGFKTAVTDDCAKISIVGGGMREVPGVMASFTAALAEKQIPILQTADSHTTISGLVPAQHMEAAVMALHDKFHLGA